jgi:superfamily I DNA and/or RNA helicase
MHPDISAFPNKAFYDSKLKDGTRNEDGIINAGLGPPKSAYTEIEEGKYRTVTFLHHMGLENARAKSTVNEGEARIIYEVVIDLLLLNPVRDRGPHVADALTHSA